MSNKSLGTVPGPVAVFRGHIQDISCLEHLSSSVFVSGSTDGEIRCWNISKLSSIWCDPLIPHINRSVLSLNRITGHEHKFLSTGRHDRIIFWDISCGSPQEYNEIAGLDIGHFCNTATDIFAESSLVATPCSSTSDVLIFDINSPTRNQVSRISQSHRGIVTSISLRTCLNDYQPVLFSGYEDGSVCIFDLRSTKEPFFIYSPHPESSLPVLSIDTGNCRESFVYVAYSGAFKTIFQHCTVFTANEPVTDIISPQEIRSSEQTKPSLLSQFFNSNPSSSNLKTLTSGVTTQCTNTMKVLLPKEGTSCLRYRFDGKLLFSGHWDRTVRVYDTKRLKPLAILNHHRDVVTAISCPNGLLFNKSDFEPYHFLSASKDRTIAMWNLYKQ